MSSSESIATNRRMVEADDKLIDASSATLYAVKDITDDNQAELIKTEQITVPVDKLDARVDTGELLSIRKLQERITKVADGYHQGVAMLLLKQLLDGDDPAIDVPDDVLEFVQNSVDDDSDEEDTDPDDDLAFA